MKKSILDRPWLLIVGGYLAGLCGWVTMVYLAVQHQPESIPLDPPATLQKSGH